jgi:hypothetical protein
VTDHSYSFDLLIKTPKAVLNYKASPGSYGVFRSYDIEFMSIPKKRKSFAVIDVNNPLPLLEYQNMDPYLLLARDMP